MGTTRVLIADSRRLFAEALGDALRERPGLEVLGSFPSHGREVLNVVGIENPDVVLLDSWIGEMHGATVARLIKRWAPGCKVVLLTWFPIPVGSENTQSALSAVVSKGAGLAEIEEVIRVVHSSGEAEDRPAGDRPASGAKESDDAGVDELERLLKLSSREMDVLTLLAFRPKDIAETLGISEKTVRNHINSILRKTGARSAVEAVAIGRRNGIV